MALNLSRNTKVFVSSVNGVTTAGGQFLTGYISAGGSNYVEGDRLLFRGAVTQDVYFTGIVKHHKVLLVCDVMNERSYMTAF